MSKSSMASATTTDHATIRKWVEDRDGRPATVMGTDGDGDVGVLRIDFPGYGKEEDLRQISWENFFRKFDEENLAFLHQDRTGDGAVSRFCKFVNR